jgi:hypothetical protein
MNYSNMNFSNMSSSNTGRSNARNYRALAAECERQAELAFEEPHFRELQMRLAKSYSALAETEEWLEGRFAPEQDARMNVPASSQIAA